MIKPSRSGLLPWFAETVGAMPDTYRLSEARWDPAAAPVTDTGFSPAARAPADSCINARRFCFRMETPRKRLRIVVTSVRRLTRQGVVNELVLSRKCRITENCAKWLKEESLPYIVSRAQHTLSRRFPTELLRSFGERHGSG